MPPMIGMIQIQNIHESIVISFSVLTTMKNFISQYMTLYTMFGYQHYNNKTKRCIGKGSAIVLVSIVSFFGALIIWDMFAYLIGIYQ